MKKVKSAINKSGVMIRAGFTLLEILVTIAVLATSITFLYGAFFKSGDILNTLSRRFRANLVADNLFAEGEQYFHREKGWGGWVSKGETTLDGETYSFSVEKVSQDTLDRLYELKAVVKWHGSSDNQIARSCYVIR